jgi:hypothetical protein
MAGLNLTALGLKWLSTWLILLLFSMVFGPSGTQAAVMAAAVAVLSWLADRLIAFQFQGITRFAIDSGLAGLGIYLSQFLWPGPGITFPLAVFAGFVVGAVEIPLHFYLAARFGLRKRNDERDGIH